MNLQQLNIKVDLPEEKMQELRDIIMRNCTHLKPIVIDRGYDVVPVDMETVVREYIDEEIQTIKNQRSKCICPSENFSFNGIGCKCGGN